MVNSVKDTICDWPQYIITTLEMSHPLDINIHCLIVLVIACKQKLYIAY